MPATRKNSCADSHAAIAGAAMLKSALMSPGCRREIQKEITSASSVTMTVPAAGPYSSTAVKTNVSEMEIEATDEGKRTVADPLTKVSPANMNHRYPIGCSDRS